MDYSQNSRFEKLSTMQLIKCSEMTFITSNIISTMLNTKLTENKLLPDPVLQFTEEEPFNGKELSFRQ